jgi:ABC-type uncharacterized transport system permease subunit
MILSSASSQAAWAPGAATALVLLAVALYALAALPVATLKRFCVPALVGGWVLHGLLLVFDIAGVGQATPGARLGFAPVLSLTVWLVIAVYAIESRLVPLPAVRLGLALSGLMAVVVTWIFPGEFKPITNPLAPLHFTLGVGAYALFGAAVLHALMLDSAERRLRGGGAARLGLADGPSGALGPKAGGSSQALGMPLLQLERLTFRFVQAGFVVLTATLVLGLATMVSWSWRDHKAVFSLLAWAVFAALLLGRWQRGWRGRRATRWLYAGAVLLLLAYVGSRFVLEVLLQR